MLTHSEDNDSNHILIARNSFLSQLYLVVNYILVLSSLYLVSLSIWVLFGQDKQGLNAFIPIGGAYLRSLTAYGLCFLFAGTSVLLNSIFIGLENNRPGIVNGFKKETERKHFLYSQVISGAIVLLLTLILFATIPPLSTVLSSGVSDTTWRNMATQYPQSVCAFQVAKNCAGAVDYICMSPNARSTSVSCPGHHCADSCRFLSRRPVVHARACQNCETLSSSTLLQQCKSTEARLSSSRNCIEPLVRVVRHFYLITLISACIVMFFTIIAMSAAMVGFLCSN